MDKIDSYKYYRGKKLQDWYHIEIETVQLPEEKHHFETGTNILVTTKKKAFFCSRIHVDKRVQIGASSYSGLFTNREILNCHYLSTDICKMYGDIFTSAN